MPFFNQKFDLISEDKYKILIMDARNYKFVRGFFEPKILINTEMHTTWILRISCDGQEKILVSGSIDKTVRLWNIETGKLIKVLRIPIAGGDAGKVSAVSITPDGKYIAVGGWTRVTEEKIHPIYIFEVESGEIVKSILDLNGVTLHLAYSHDSNFLVASVENNYNYGIKVYERYNEIEYNLVFEDISYEDRCEWAQFDKDNNILTASYDGFIRLYKFYDSEFKLIAEKKTKGGDQPLTISFSPDFKKIAVGFNDSTNIDLYSYPNLMLIKTYELSKTYESNSNFRRVSFSKDGRFIFSGGRYSEKTEDGNIKIPIRKLSIESDIFENFDIALKNTVTGIIPLSSKRILCSSSAPEITLISEKGDIYYKVESVIPDFRENTEGFLISLDGSRVRFSFEYGGKDEAEFCLKSLTLIKQKEEFKDDISMLKPKIKGEKINVTNWKNNYNPYLNGKLIKLRHLEFSRSLALMPDESGFVLGTEWRIRFYDSDGTLKWNKPSPSTTWSVNISGDGRLVIAAFGDGTIRWYRRSDGKLLLTLFIHKDGNKWVLWTPKGYYLASPGGEDLFGWHLNKGLDKTPEFYPASRFRDQFYRPDVIEKILETLDEDKALEIANKESSIETKARKITQILPPTVKILEPKDGEKIDSEELRVRYLVKNESSGNRNIKVLIDGRPFLQVERGIPVSEGPSGVVEELAIVVPKKDFELGLIASNIHSSSVPHTIKLFWTGENREHFRKPELYVVAIGVSNYANSSLNLNYAHKDAQDFINVLMGQKERFYSDIKYRLLINQDATKDNILEALEWLQSSVRKDDVAMLFFAGHGKSDSVGIYYFLPYDGELESLKRTGISFSEIRNTVSTIQAKVILFIDTCHAGGVLGGKRLVKGLTRMINEFSSPESGVIVFASAGDNQYSYEAPLWNNGAFTKALVEILSGESLKLPEGELTVFLLSYYLSKRVRELTNNNQIPVVMIPQIIPDFPLAAVV